MTSGPFNRRLDRIEEAIGGRCQQSAQGTVRAALGMLTDAELDALEAVAKRGGWVAETEGEVAAIAHYDRVAELIGQA